MTKSGQAPARRARPSPVVKAQVENGGPAQLLSTGKGPVKPADPRRLKITSLQAGGRSSRHGGGIRS